MSGGISGQHVEALRAKAAEAAVVSGPAAIDPVKTASTSLAGEFNYKAAAKVFLDKGTLEMGWFGNPDVDATIKGSTVQTNLEAMHAGYKGTSIEGDVKSFKDVILKHKDLTDSASEMLKDEGDNVLTGMEKLLTGNGKIDAATFEKAMEDPVYRDLVAQMMKRVGTSDLGMDYTVDFLNGANDLMEKKDAATYKKFLEIAKKGGIDTSKLERKEQEMMMGQLQDFMKDPEKFITKFVSSMDLPPEIRNMLISVTTELAGFYGDVLGYYVNGDGNQPGFKQIGQTVMKNTAEDGAEKFEKHMGQQQQFGMHI